MVDKRTTELSLVFVVVGMMFLVPVIAGEALGSTVGEVKAFWVNATRPIPPLPLTSKLVDKHLDEGYWISQPHCYSHLDSECGWSTGGYGGPEAGHVIVGYYLVVGGKPTYVAKVKFWFYNPTKGTNTCGTDILEKLEPHVGASCHITQGSIIQSRANAEYTVTYYKNTK